MRPGSKALSPYRRELFEKFMDGRIELRWLMALLHYDPGCEPVLIWLIKNGLTGTKFMDWYKFHFAPNWRAMVRYVLSKRATSV